MKEGLYVTLICAAFLLTIIALFGFFLSGESVSGRTVTGNETAEPETAEPERASAEVTESDIKLPETKQPETMQYEIARRETTETETIISAAPGSVSAEAEPPAPEAPEPEAAEPETEETAETEPETAETSENSEPAPAAESGNFEESFTCTYYASVKNGVRTTEKSPGYFTVYYRHERLLDTLEFDFYSYDENWGRILSKGSFERTGSSGVPANAGNGPVFTYVLAAQGEKTLYAAIYPSYGTCVICDSDYSVFYVFTSPQIASSFAEDFIKAIAK